MKNIPKNNYDVIVIGAGSVGTPTAFYLVHAGLKVLVIDQAASVGQGSNKHAIGGIRATHSDPAKIRICLRSLEIISTWKEMHGDDIEWQKGGYCFVAYRDQEKQTLRELVLNQKSMGLNIDWLDKKTLLEVIPDLNPNALLGGTFSPDDGSASPLLTIHAFYRRAREKGAEFKFGESVQEIITQRGKVCGVKTNRETYWCNVVINAAGPWAASVANLANIDLPVKPDSHEAAITEPVAPFLRPMIVDIRSAMGSANFYFYQHSTGQVVFCITPQPNIWGFSIQETSQFLPMVAQRMIEIMPKLANLRVRRTWRGLYPMTPDGFPIVGWIDQAPGLLLAVGLCGQGFMLGPGLGELITRMVFNLTTPQDHETLTYLSPSRKFNTAEKLK